MAGLSSLKGLKTTVPFERLDKVHLSQGDETSTHDLKDLIVQGPRVVFMVTTKTHKAAHTIRDPRALPKHYMRRDLLNLCSRQKTVQNCMKAILDPDSQTPKRLK